MTTTQTNAEDQDGSASRRTVDRRDTASPPSARPRDISDSKDGTALDSRLRHIPDVEREF